MCFYLSNFDNELPISSIITTINGTNDTTKCKEIDLDDIQSDIEK